MNKQLGKFQMLGFSSHKGMASDQYLGSIFKLAPNKLSRVMTELLAFKRGSNLDHMLNKIPVATYPSDDEYTWDVIGSYRRNIPLLEARDEDGVVITASYSQNVGVNHAPFYLVFSEDYFGDGEVIFGNLNELYSIRVLGEPRFEGSNACYKCEIYGNNNDGIPVERLLTGERFSPAFAPVERELSRKAGTVRHGTPVAMRNEFSSVRIHSKVSGSKMHKKLMVGIPIISATTGKQEVINTWTFYEMYELERQFSDYKNHLLAFGVSTRNSNGEYTNFGKSGNAIKSGDGLFRQIEVSNTIYYNKFSLALIEDALMALSTAKLDFANRKFVIKTGELGATLFHKAVLQEVSGWRAFETVNNPGTVQKADSPLHSNALSAGMQFTSFKAPNGVVIELEVDPGYDDTVMHKIKYPGTNMPAFSARMDIFYIGTPDNANIQKVAVEGMPETRSFIAGIRDPYHNLSSVSHAAHDEDSSSMHLYAVTGICVYDPTRSVSFIPAVLQG